MNILAIDPGTLESGYVLLDDARRVLGSGVRPNEEMLSIISGWKLDDTRLAVEMVASYGMPVGREIFETVRWIGRFQQAWATPDDVRFVYRKDVKLHLCGSPRAKDPNIWQALLDKLGPVGTKGNPGPLYGVKSHARAALAVAVTFADGAQSELLEDACQS